MPSVGGGANPRQDPCRGESPSAAGTAAPRRAGPGSYWNETGSFSYVSVPVADLAELLWMTHHGTI